MAMFPACGRSIGLAIAALVAAPVLVWHEAQAQGAAVGGRITDRSTGRAVARAHVSTADGGHAVLSDSTGTFLLTGLDAGVLQLLVRAEAFPATHVIVELVDGETLERPVRLDSTATGRATQELPAVSVTDRAPAENYRLVAFEQRRHTGRGQYLTEEQIVQGGAYTLLDAVKSLRGVLYECGGGAGCHVHMSRAPMRCLPQYIIDEQVDNEFGPRTPIRDIVAIEVYSGPADIPGEFTGSNSACGVIVVWTRSGPPRRKQANGPANRPTAGAKP